MGKSFFAKPKRCASASQYTLSVGIRKSILSFRGYREGRKRVAFPLPLRGNFGGLRRPSPLSVLPRGYPPESALDGAISGVSGFPLFKGRPPGHFPDNPRTIPGHFPGIFRGFAPLYFAKFAKREPLPGGRFFLSGRVSPPYPPSIS